MSALGYGEMWGRRERVMRYGGEPLREACKTERQYGPLPYAGPNPIEPSQQETCRSGGRTAPDLGGPFLHKDWLHPETQLLAHPAWLPDAPSYS